MALSENAAAVLDALSRAKHPITTKGLAAMARISNTEVQLPLRQLIDADKVVKFGNGYYQIKDEFRTVEMEYPGVFDEKGVREAKEIKRRKAQREKNKSMRRILDAMSVKKPVKQTEPKPSICKVEEKPMPETETNGGQYVPSPELQNQLGDVISKMNMPVVNIPPLPEAELKLYILKQLAQGIDDVDISVQLEEFRVWARDVLMLK